MRIYAETVPPEVSVETNRRELSALVGMIQSGSGNLPTNVAGSPAPYSALLVGVRVNRELDHQQRVRVFVDWSQETLVISGGQESLNLFAQDLEGVVPALVGSHHHFEYLPGNPYFGRDSVPTVVELIE